jgi:hypothetical protein
VLVELLKCHFHRIGRSLASSFLLTHARVRIRMHASLIAYKSLLRLQKEIIEEEKKRTLNTCVVDQQTNAFLANLRLLADIKDSKQVYGSNNESKNERKQK